MVVTITIDTLFLVKMAFRIWYVDDITLLFLDSSNPVQEPESMKIALKGFLKLPLRFGSNTVA